MTARRRNVGIALIAFAMIAAVTMTFRDDTERKLRRDCLAAFARSEKPARNSILMPFDNRERLRVELFAIANRYGTNATPIFLKWIEAVEPPRSQLKERAEIAGQKLKIKSPVFWHWVQDGDRYRLAALASEALPLIRPPAHSAVPILREMEQRNSNATPFAREALTGIRRQKQTK